MFLHHLERLDFCIRLERRRLRLLGQSCSGRSEPTEVDKLRHGGPLSILVYEDVAADRAVRMAGNRRRVFSRQCALQLRERRDRGKRQPIAVDFHMTVGLIFHVVREIAQRVSLTVHTQLWKFGRRNTQAGS